MAHVLIGYATHTGAAGDIARAVARAFQSAGHQVRIAQLRDLPEVEDADLVVLGSGINAGSWYSEATSWVRANAAALTSTKVAVFNTCLNAAEPDKHDAALGYNDWAISRSGAVASETFVGRYSPAEAGFFSRVLAKITGKTASDGVDPAKAARWADDLLTLV